MNDLQISMIDNQAAAIARDALDSGDLMVRQLADDTLALIAEVRRLRANLDAVPVYARGIYGEVPPISFEDWYALVQSRCSRENLR